MFRKTRSHLRRINFPYRRHLVKNKCVFIHIPKNAGSSILKSLGASGGRDHLPWYVYYTADPDLYKQYFKFCIVRNPWDRVLSSYRYLEKGGNQADDLKTAKIINKYGTFDSFVQNGLYEGYFRNHLLFLPQSEFILGPEGQAMVDFVGRFETLDGDYQVIRKKLNLSSELSWINKTPEDTNPASYRNAYINSETIEVVSQIYKQDVNVFDYQF